MAEALYLSLMSKKDNTNKTSLKIVNHKKINSIFEDKTALSALSYTKIHVLSYTKIYIVYFKRL